MGTFFIELGLRALGLGRLLGRGIAWLFEKPVRLAIASLLAMVIIEHVTILIVVGQRDAARRHGEVVQAAFDRTVETYRKARLEAERLQGQRDKRVAEAQAAITKETVDDYEARLADARARADRLRKQLAAQADRSHSGEAGVSAPGQAAGGAAKASGDQGLSATGEACRGGMTLNERLIATEQAIQLDALIDWVTKQSAIDVNAEAPAGQ